jgi:hypothetical protein
MLWGDRMKENGGNKQGTCQLIDVAIPGDRNVVKKEAEKI